MPTTTYVTVSELKARLDIPDTGDDTELAAAIEAASRMVDEFCGRRFWADDDAAQIRYYTPWDPYEVRIDDAVTITSVETSADPTVAVWATAWATPGDYLLWPHNATQDSSDVRPFTRIEATSGGRYVFATHQRAVRVTGKFGWPAVPKTVSTATALQAARLFKRQDAPFGVAAVPSFEGVGMRLLARLDADVELLLRPYQKVTVGAVG